MINTVNGESILKPEIEQSKRETLTQILKKDFAQYGLTYKKSHLLKYFFGKSVALKFLCRFRTTQYCSNKIFKKILRQFLMRTERKYGIEIPDTVGVGGGIYRTPLWNNGESGS